MEYCTLYNNISKCNWRYNHNNSCYNCSYKIKVSIDYDLFCNSCDTELISDEVDWYNGDTWICPDCNGINNL